jgi:hypothetical protein
MEEEEGLGSDASCWCGWELREQLTEAGSSASGPPQPLHVRGLAIRQSSVAPELNVTAKLGSSLRSHTVEDEVAAAEPHHRGRGHHRGYPAPCLASIPPPLLDS